MFKRPAITALAVATVFSAGLVVGNTVTDSAVSADAIETDEFVIYEQHDLYWVFQHSDTICDTARRAMVAGLGAREAADEAVGALPAEADTVAAATYTRGVLRGCLG